MSSALVLMALAATGAPESVSFEAFRVSFAAVFSANFVLAQFLGLCPFLGVSDKTSSAVGMGFAVVFVMTMASAVTYAVYAAPWIGLKARGLHEFLYIVVFILVIACLVQFVEMFVRKSSDALYRAWYRKKLRRRLSPPPVGGGSDSPPEAEGVILPEWRCGPKPASHEVFRCSEEYLLEFISENADTVPIFEILPDPVPGFRLVPSGIVYRITRDPTLEPDPEHWDFSFHDERFDQSPDLIEGYNDAIVTVLNGYIAAYKNLADWYFWKKKLAPQAARYYEKTLKLIKAHSRYRAFDPAFQVQVLNSAGIAHSEAGDYELAMQNIDLGLELAPFDASLYINKAVIRKKQGDPEKARQALRKALSLEPGNAMALSLLKKM